MRNLSSLQTQLLRRAANYIGVTGLGTLALTLSGAPALASTVGAAASHAGTAASSARRSLESVDYLSVSPGMKPGPDGKLHDAFSQTTFDVRAGTPIRLVIHNTDDVPHGIVSPAAGVHIVVAPGTHTYTLVVKKAGVYRWYCNKPCDTYSMTHMGYMTGQIVAR
jgi:uncharacterized cupredoxin-like copper-binding protein